MYARWSARPKAWQWVLFGASGVFGAFACARDTHDTEAPVVTSASASVVAAAPSASGAALTPELASKVLAQVGERSITLGDYAAALERMDRFDRLRYQTKERRRQLLEEMIDVELLAREAERQGLDQLPETQELLRQFLRDEVSRQLRSNLPAPDELPEAEVRKYYQDHQDEYADAERRRVSVIALDSLGLAEQVLARAMSASPESWGELVLQHSKLGRKPAVGDAERSIKPPLELAGDLGIVGPPGDSKGDNPSVPGLVRRAVFGLKELGQVAPEVVSEGGRHYIVRLMGKTEAHQRSFSEAERSIRVRLVELELLRAEAELEAHLIETVPVKINRKALAGIPEASPSPGVGP